MTNPSELIWKGVKFPTEKMTVKRRKAKGCSDPIGLGVFKAGVAGKKLKRVC